MTIPAHQQIPEMTVMGHNTATIRESLLETAFELGEKFIAASKEHYDPGIIGPFCLQTCSGKDMNYSIYASPKIRWSNVASPLVTRMEMQHGKPVIWKKNYYGARAVEQDRLQVLVIGVDYGHLCSSSFLLFLSIF